MRHNKERRRLEDEEERMTHRPTYKRGKRDNHLWY